MAGPRESLGRDSVRSLSFPLVQPLLVFSSFCMISGGVGFQVLSFPPLQHEPVKVAGSHSAQGETGFLTTEAKVWHYTQETTDRLKENITSHDDTSPQRGQTVGFSEEGHLESTSASSKTTRLFLLNQADDVCKRYNASVATVKTRGEDRAFDAAYRESGQPVALGLTTYEPSLPDVYLRAIKWVDNTIAYEMNVTYFAMYSFAEGNKLYLFGGSDSTTVHFRTSKSYFEYAMCEAVRGNVAPRSSSSTIIPAIRREMATAACTTLSPKLTHSLIPANMSRIEDRVKRLHLVTCPNGHVTFDFLSCDPGADCFRLNGARTCAVPEGRQLVNNASSDTAVDLFDCEDGTKVHHTLVCDFRPHCADGSDEDFCTHELSSCPGFTREPRAETASVGKEIYTRGATTLSSFVCRNKQCVHIWQVCDFTRNCVDGSDEEGCPYSKTPIPPYYRQVLSPPALINFAHDGSIIYSAMADLGTCPETHLACPGEFGYCLPVFVRCNSVFDCPGREDEEGCDSYTCPGFYRCYGSRVCVHVDHLCDGLPHCPRHDDELLCDLQCPQGCGCQGLAFVCRQPFPTLSFPRLRYLDAALSGIQLFQLSNNTYLVWLSLASCSLASLGDRPLLPNLHTLDLANNLLSVVSMDTFAGLPNLRFLSLEGNPITSFQGGPSDIRQSRLVTFHAPHTNLRVFNSSVLSRFTQLQSLNLSFGKIHTITREGLAAVPAVTTLDLRGNPLDNFPSDLFEPFNPRAPLDARFPPGNRASGDGLGDGGYEASGKGVLRDVGSDQVSPRGFLGGGSSNERITLQRVYSGNFRLCCPSVLPAGFDENFCFAPEDELSSCQDLLRSDAFRASLWTMGLLALVGNAGCLLLRSVVATSRDSGFAVFVKSLCLSDLLMGVYLLTIGAADRQYRGVYTLHEKDWRGSTLCRLGGVVSLLSSEVSAFMICLITLDRFIVLRFPFTTFRFHRLSAILACLLAWVLGGALVAVPLLPGTSHWEFYGQTGICIPLPVIRKEFAGRDYAFGVMIVANLVLFLLIAAGQVAIYRAIVANAMTSNRGQELAIARRLATVVLSDFLCWFPIGLVGVLAESGIPVRGELSVVLAIFVLPLNSALNPFLYTYSVLAEQRRKAYEDRLTKLLEAQLAHDDGGETTAVDGN